MTDSLYCIQCSTPYMMPDSLYCIQCSTPCGLRHMMLMKIPLLKNVGAYFWAAESAAGLLSAQRRLLSHDLGARLLGAEHTF